MMRRILVALSVTLLSFALFAEAADPPAAAKKSDDKTPASIQEEARFKQEILARQFQEFELQLLQLANRLASSGKQEDREKAQVLMEAIKLANTEGVDVRFQKLVDLLKKSKAANLQDVKEAIDQGELIIQNLQAILALLVNSDTRDAKLRAEKERIQNLLKELNKIIRDQKIVRVNTDRGNMDPDQLARDQERVAKATADLAREMGGKGIDDKGAIRGEGKSGKGQGEAKQDTRAPKGEGKNADGKSGDGKEGKSGDGKGGDGKEGKGGDGKAGEGKEGKGADGKGGDGKAGEGKEGKGGDGKGGEGKAGEGKEGKGGDGKGGEGKAGEGKEGKGGDGKGGDGKAGEGKEGKGGDGKGGDGKGGDGKGGDPKAGEGRGGNPKAGDGKGGEGKGGDPKAGGEGKGGDPKAGGDGKGGAGKAGEGKGQTQGKGQGKGGDGKGAGKAGEGKGAGKGGDGKGGDGKGGDGKGGDGKGGDGKGGDGKGGDGKGGQQGQARGAGQQGGGQQGGGKKGPQDPQQPQAPGRQQVEDALPFQKQARNDIQNKDNPAATKNEDKALDELEKARRRLEEILKQLREEELERLLALLQARCEYMLQLQKEVYEGTVRLDKAIGENPNKKPGRPDEQKSQQLADREGLILNEAVKARELIVSEGTAVAFAEQFTQLIGDVRLVHKNLNKTDVGLFTQKVERDIIETLMEMIEALKKAQQEMKQQQQQGQPGNPPPPGQQQQRLIDLLAELKMIRSMQVRVNKRTEDYGKLYPGEQANDPEIQKQLRDLSERQEKLKKIAHDIATGKNQ